MSDRLLSNGLISKTWLSMSMGFRGTKEAIRKGNYQLLQRAPATTLCGLGVDFNEANPVDPDFGAFTIDDDPVDGALEPVLQNRYIVIARNGLRLREGPGTQFEVIGSMRPGQVIFATITIDGWARVDVEGDGLIDGFASADFLQRT
ncbi:SH3 domain-containing protein [Dyadobacter fermentans]|nr:SH3 domain-containing protein [Dyadobacter fermentans]